MTVVTGHAVKPGHRHGRLGRESVIVIVSYFFSQFYRGPGPRLAYPALDNPRRNRISPIFN